MLFMDRFVAVHFDYCVWKYCVANNILVSAIPRSVCLGQRAFNLGPMCRYSDLMLFYIQTR